MSLPSTFATIRGNVIAKARLDTTDDATRTSDWINQVYMDVAVETRCFQTNADATLTAGTTSYTLDAQVLHIELITCTQLAGQAGQPVKQCQISEILDARATNASQRGPATKYALVGLNQLELWPAASAGDVLTFWYSYLPGALSDPDVPAFPEPFGSKLLEYGALCQAAEFKRDVMMLGNYQAQYDEQMREFQKFLNRKAGSYPGAFPTWTRSDWFVPHDPSSDWMVL
jgi:hypothetical protein